MSGQQASQYSTQKKTKLPGEEHLALLPFLKDLHEDDLTAYKEICELLQQNLSGIVTADSLFEELTLAGCEITCTEVEDILRDVRRDSTGKVYLLDLLKYVSRIDGKQSVKHSHDGTKKLRWHSRQLFSAINAFATKQAIRDIERTFRSKAPNILPHYMAGVKLLGLTTSQLQKKMDRMFKTKYALKSHSPYAKPLTFIHVDTQKTVSRKAIGMDLQQLTKSIEEVSKIVRWADGAQCGHVVDDEPNTSKATRDGRSCDTDAKKDGGADIAGASEVRLSEEMANVVRNFTELQSQINLVADILDDAKRVRTSPCLKRKQPGRKKTVNNYVPPEKMVQTNHLSTSTALPGMKIRNKRKFNKGLPWTTPQIEHLNVPIPRVRLAKRGKPVPYPEMERERKQIAEAKDKYYQQLVEKEQQNALTHWNRIYSNTDMPKTFREHFRAIYDIYYPTRAEEIFVHCPTLIFPFRTRSARP